MTGHLFESTEAGIAPADAVCKSERVRVCLRSATLQLLQKMRGANKKHTYRGMCKKMYAALLSPAPSEWCARPRTDP